MASCTSRLVLALWVAAVLLAVVLFGLATAGSAPSYCVPGQGIPYSPLSGCVWYVATRSCDVPVAIKRDRAFLKPTCCGQLQDIPAECRCRALRVMMETDPGAVVVGADPAAQRRCRAAQDRFTPSVVTPAECGLRTVHGRPFCNALDAE